MCIGVCLSQYVYVYSLFLYVCLLLSWVFLGVHIYRSVDYHLCLPLCKYPKSHISSVLFYPSLSCTVLPVSGSLSLSLSLSLFLSIYIYTHILTYTHTYIYTYIINLREKHQFVVPLTDAFIGCFLSVPWPGTGHTTLAYWDDDQGSWHSLLVSAVFLCVCVCAMCMYACVCIWCFHTVRKSMCH